MLSLLMRDDFVPGEEAIGIRFNVARDPSHSPSDPHPPWCRAAHRPRDRRQRPHDETDTANTDPVADLVSRL